MTDTNAAPAARMTAERLAEIRNAVVTGCHAPIVGELLRELDAVTKERDEVTEQLEGAKRHTTRVESIARERAQVTYAMVERTARAMCEQAAGADFWSGVNSDRRDHYRTLARAALTAALTPEARGQ